MQIRIIPARTAFVALAMLAVAVLVALLAGVTVGFATWAAAHRGGCPPDGRGGGLRRVSQRLASRCADADPGAAPGVCDCRQASAACGDRDARHSDRWLARPALRPCRFDLSDGGTADGSRRRRCDAARADISRNADIARGSGVRAGRRARAIAPGFLRDARARRRAPAAPRLSGFCADRALCLAGGRPAAAGDWRQDLPAARRRHRLQAALGISGRRLGAPHRLARHAAPRQTHRPPVSGRARSVRDAPHRLWPSHARRRQAAGQRDDTLRPGVERRHAA